jgi:hypothetical protein
MIRIAANGRILWDHKYISCGFPAIFVIYYLESFSPMNTINCIKALSCALILGLCPSPNIAQNLDVVGKIQIGDDGSTPAAGMIRWNVTSKDFEGYDGMNWLSLTGKLPCNFIILSETAIENGGSIIYTATAAANDMLILELYNSPTTGTFALGSNYSMCDQCLLISSSCIAMNCDKTFLATNGQLELFSVSGFLNGSLSNVDLVEVVIDPNTFESTPVPGGMTRCLDGLDFVTTINMPPPPGNERSTGELATKSHTNLRR